MRDYSIRRDLQAIGLPERTIRVLEKVQLLIDALEQINAQGGAITDLEEATDALGEAVEDANVSLVTLDMRLDVIEDDYPYVSADAGPTWTDATGTAARTALASYAGQVVSNPPTQAEMQALDDAVKAISQHVVALINDLKANGALT